MGNTESQSLPNKQEVGNVRKEEETEDKETKDDKDNRPSTLFGDFDSFYSDHSGSAKGQTEIKG